MDNRPSPHLTLAHQYWAELLQPGDWAIDATCGNGKDTLRLAQILLSKGADGGLIGIDIQADAIRKTGELLAAHLTQEELKQTSLFLQSHVCFPSPAYAKPIRLIVYNLGYLPGSDKQVKTLSPTTQASVQAALDLIVPGGAVSLTCYPGHPEGAVEYDDLKEMLSQLDSQQWDFSHHAWSSKRAAPALLIVNKKF